MVGIWNDIKEQVNGDLQTQVELRTWDDNFDALAELISRFKGDSKPRIYIYAYSWGVGKGALKLCKALRKRDLEVKLVVSIDGVYRSKFLTFRWLALTDRVEIQFPRGVREIVSFRQKTTLPYGHVILRKMGKGTFNFVEITTRWLQWSHQYIDNAPEVRSYIASRVKRSRKENVL